VKSQRIWPWKRASLRRSSKVFAVQIPIAGVFLDSGMKSDDVVLIYDEQPTVEEVVDVGS